MRLMTSSDRWPGCATRLQQGGRIERQADRRPPCDDDAGIIEVYAHISLSTANQVTVKLRLHAAQSGVDTYQVNVIYKNCV